MTPSKITFDSLLAVDIGETTTRAILFDIVDGTYRFIAAGSAPSTIGLPLRNVAEGVRLAIDDLYAITGRILIGHDERLIVPSTGDGSGVDAFALVLSGGPPLKVVIAGLLEEVSVESARQLAETTYAQVVDTFSLNDRRKSEARLDALLRLQPDLVLIAGGTEGGAAQSVFRTLEPVRLACNLLPAQARPQLLYAGNQALAERIQAVFSPLTHVELAPNLRPDLETEQIEPAHVFLSRLYRNAQIKKLAGLQELDSWAGGGLLPRATAFSRMIRFLSLDDATKGVLGVDLGVNATTITAAVGGRVKLGVYKEFGLGHCAEVATRKENLARILEWLPVDLSEDYVRDYIFNKMITPAALPLTADDLALEQALARYVLRMSAQRISKELHDQNGSWAAQQLLPPMEPLIAAGNILTNAPNLGHSLLILLDSLQPTGITTIILDRNNLTPALGAAAGLNPTLVVQVLDSGTFTNLGTVISPMSTAKPGTPILRVQMTYKDSNEETKVDIKQGSLEVLPLAPGQVASLYLKPFHRADIGMGPGKGGSLKRVVGGAMGLIIDARGRPLKLSSDSARRKELLRKWLWTLGG
jgi:hypothetical protein